MTMSSNFFLLFPHVLLFFQSLLRVVCPVMLLWFIFLGVVVARCQFKPARPRHACICQTFCLVICYNFFIVVVGMSHFIMLFLMPCVHMTGHFLFEFSLTGPYRFLLCQLLHERKSFCLGQCHMFFLLLGQLKRYYTYLLGGLKCCQVQL